MTTITVDRAVLEQVLQALEGELPDWRTPSQARAITALRAALAQQEEEDIAQNLQSRLDAALLLEERRQEIAQPHRETEQEPVAWMAPNGDLRKDRTPRKFSDWGWRQEDYVPLYTHPPRREWQSLSEEDINAIWCGAVMAQSTKSPGLGVSGFARAVEAALKEKNNG